MQEIPSLLDKYKAGTTTQEELKQLLQLLETDDAGLKEWLRGAYDRDQAIQLNVLSPQQSDNILQRIQAKKAQQDVQSLPPRRAIRMPWRQAGWAAACILLVLAGVRLLSPGKGSRAKVLAATGVAPVSQTRQVSNTGSTEMRIVLNDQSVVLLQPNSAVSWYENFDSTKRDISLSGKARFNVAKDKTRPFTVYANGIATTAVGTQFSVSTLIRNKVEVKLFEGRVKIAATGNALTMKPVYLEPGQAFAIDEQLRQYAVSTFNDSLSSRRTPGETKRDVAANATTLVFNGESLPNVFRKIGALYNVHISYDNQAMNRLHFTGTFLRSDSLQFVLSVVCNMNELVFKQDQNNISINKIK